MMKDRRQKEAALQYIVGKRWFPQLELVVQPASSASARTYDITDIDAYGAAPDDFSGYRVVLFDCKSGRRESPITRAMWLKGLMEHLGASRGICILGDGKEIALDHRDVASELDVSIMTTSEFGAFAHATDSKISPEFSHLANIDNWDSFFRISDRYKSLNSAIQFSINGFWRLKRPGDGCRHTIALLRRLKGELDPGKTEHLAVFGDLLSLFLFAVSQVGHRLFAAYVQPASRKDLDTILLPYIYGGRETYHLINQINQFINRKAESPENTEATLPEWDGFAHLVRSILDAPVQALYAPLLAREVAWSFLNREKGCRFAQHLALSQRQTGKFCIIAAKYLVQAAKLPPEFLEIYQQSFISIQSPNESMQPELPMR